MPRQTKAEGCAWVALLMFAGLCTLVGLCYFIGWGIQLARVVAGL